MRNIYYLKAVSEALFNEMEINPDVVVIGEDVRYSLRGITKGFIDIFGPDRVIDTPISEAGLTGVGTGAALSGLRPVLEFQICEFIFFAFDQLVDQAQKLRYMSGGKLKAPVTYLIASSGARGGMAGQHSDNPYPYLLHSGMKTVMPSTPYDAKGLLVSAIRDDDPVAVFLPVNSLGTKGDVPEEQYTIPLGKGEIKKEGKDITVVSTGHLVKIALETAEELESSGISVEVYDPRTLLPLDRELLFKSVKKTGRVIVFDDSNRTCGFAAEVSAIISEECFTYLKSPVRRITRADVPIPFNAQMESFVLPDKEKLIKVILKNF
ncbi:MAG: alpha-ketoacid dehydrogenase subunit beta [Actinobacteria bacterium]|nr:alpha-ketoacid dehydrogenase subunit beta [Cyanobacteriota bacterium]MCL5770851.1 alpha-ketoacid dehydrogenase subunit beta [Actinomycetota bacterium]